MVRTPLALPLLALAACARAQSSTSATPSSSAATASASSAAAPQQTTVTVPAFSTDVQGSNNATVTAGWSTDSARGTLTQGLTLLANSSQTASNSSIYGVVLQFNATHALSNASTSTDIPWIAFISCDEPSESVTSAGLPLSAASVSAAAATATATASVANGTAMNTTALAVNGTAGNTTLSLVDRATEFGASAVLLYSETGQSCALNLTALFPSSNSTASNSTSTSSNSTSASNSTLSTAPSSQNYSIPLFASPSQSITQLFFSQWTNLPPSYSYYNSTLLAESTGNLTAVVSAAAGSGSGSNSSTGGFGSIFNTPTNFLLARIVPYYTEGDSNNGVVATLSRAGGPSSTASSPSQTASGSTGSPSSGSGGSNAARGRWERLGGKALVGFVGGAVLAGVGVLV
ncbi:hypothetical protein JCM10207_007763 [Rhodosporidiobolus poonsookiae]